MDIHIYVYSNTWNDMHKSQNCDIEIITSDLKSTLCKISLYYRKALIYGHETRTGSDFWVGARDQVFWRE